MLQTVKNYIIRSSLCKCENLRENIRFNFFLVSNPPFYHKKATFKTLKMVQ